MALGSAALGLAAYLLLHDAHWAVRGKESPSAAPRPDAPPEHANSLDVLAGSIAELSGDLRECPIPESSRSALPTDDVTADSVAATASASAEWSKIPRSTTPLGKQLVLLPSDLRAEMFLRHIQLNPRDVPVPHSEREQLDAVLRVIGDRFHEFQEAQGRVALADMQAATPADYEELPPKEASVSPGKVPGTTSYRSKLRRVGITTFSNGKAYRVKSPMFDSTMEHRAFLVVEVGSAITWWFQVRGYCDSTEAAAVVAEIFTSAESAFFRKPRK